MGSHDERDVRDPRDDRPPLDGTPVEAAPHSARDEASDLASPDGAASGDELARCRAQVVELTERYQRLAADFANQRRRESQERTRAVDAERERLQLAWLEVLDDLERALGVSAEASADALREGLEAVLRSARSLLASDGIQRVASVGEPFDPEVHEAVGVAPGDPGVVQEEVRAGYRGESGTLRPARVLVGQGS